MEGCQGFLSMDAPSTRGRFRLLVRDDKVDSIPIPLLTEIEHYADFVEEPASPFEVWHFPGYRASVVSDISLSLAFAGVIHAVDFQLEDA